MSAILMRSLGLALLLCSTNSLGDTLKIPLGQQGSQYTGGLPQRGHSQNHVLQTWGEPVKRHASIGQPPITRWDYPDFSVYFEYRHVLSSVRQQSGTRP